MVHKLEKSPLLTGRSQFSSLLRELGVEQSWHIYYWQIIALGVDDDRISLNLRPDIPFRNLTSVTDGICKNLHALILAEELHFNFVKDLRHPSFRLGLVWMLGRKHHMELNHEGKFSRANDFPVKPIMDGE
uniref:Uncharacterized protein n=1 Tax=Arundo donax TaxID=35708 RepID=A0A0A9DEN8_ARUDO